ncbi:MAG: alpha/beta fold hydrolase [Candidatus Thorarchaeota archaeon]
MQNIIFIHGLESSGRGFKGRFFKTIFPDILTPDFKEFEPNIKMYSLLEARMGELNSILNNKKNWILIGSSFGGLMGTIYTLKNPDNVIRLILLAPFLVSRKLKPSFYKAVDVPVTIFHGEKDDVVRYKPSLERAKMFFTNLEFNLVDDDHFLHKTVKSINWKELISNN